MFGISCSCELASVQNVLIFSDSFTCMYIRSEPASAITCRMKVEEPRGAIYYILDVAILLYCVVHKFVYDKRKRQTNSSRTFLSNTCVLMVGPPDAHFTWMCSLCSTGQELVWFSLSDPPLNVCCGSLFVQIFTGYSVHCTIKIIVMKSKYM